MSDSLALLLMKESFNGHIVQQSEFAAKFQTTLRDQKLHEFGSFLIKQWLIAFLVSIASVKNPQNSLQINEIFLKLGEKGIATILVLDSENSTTVKGFLFSFTNNTDDEVSFGKFETGNILDKIQEKRKIDQIVLYQYTIDFIDRKCNKTDKFYHVHMDSVFLNSFSLIPQKPENQIDYHSGFFRLVNSNNDLSSKNPHETSLVVTCLEPIDSKDVDSLLEVPGSTTLFNKIYKFIIANSNTLYSKIDSKLIIIILHAILMGHFQNYYKIEAVLRSKITDPLSALAISYQPSNLELPKIVLIEVSSFPSFYTGEKSTLPLRTDFINDMYTRIEIFCNEFSVCLWRAEEKVRSNEKLDNLIRYPWNFLGHLINQFSSIISTKTDVWYGDFIVGFLLGDSEQQDLIRRITIINDIGKTRNYEINLETDDETHHLNLIIVQNHTSSQMECVSVMKYDQITLNPLYPSNMNFNKLLLKAEPFIADFQVEVGVQDNVRCSIASGNKTEIMYPSLSLDSVTYILGNELIGFPDNLAQCLSKLLEIATIENIGTILIGVSSNIFTPFQLKNAEYTVFQTKRSESFLLFQFFYEPFDENKLRIRLDEITQSLIGNHDVLAGSKTYCYLTFFDTISEENISISICSWKNDTEITASTCFHYKVENNEWFEEPDATFHMFSSIISISSLKREPDLFDENLIRYIGFLPIDYTKDYDKQVNRINMLMTYCFMGENIKYYVLDQLQYDYSILNFSKELEDWNYFENPSNIFVNTKRPLLVLANALLESDLATENYTKETGKLRSAAPNNFYYKHSFIVKNLKHFAPRVSSIEMSSIFDSDQESLVKVLNHFDSEIIENQYAKMLTLPTIQEISIPVIDVHRICFNVTKKYVEIIETTDNSCDFYNPIFFRENIIDMKNKGSVCESGFNLELPSDLKVKAHRCSNMDLKKAKSSVLYKSENFMTIKSINPSKQVSVLFAFDGMDIIIGKPDQSNIIFLGSGTKSVSTGSHDDIFVVEDFCNTSGIIDAGPGQNTLVILEPKHPTSACLKNIQGVGNSILEIASKTSTRRNLLIRNVQHIYGTWHGLEYLEITCLLETVELTGGNKTNWGEIVIKNSFECSHQVTLFLHGFTKICINNLNSPKVFEFIVYSGPVDFNMGQKSENLYLIVKKEFSRMFSVQLTLNNASRSYDLSFIHVNDILTPVVNIYKAKTTTKIQFVDGYEFITDGHKHKALAGCENVHNRLQVLNENFLQKLMSLGVKVVSKCPNHDTYVHTGIRVSEESDIFLPENYILYENDPRTDTYIQTVELHHDICYKLKMECPKNTRMCTRNVFIALTISNRYSLVVDLRNIGSNITKISAAQNATAKKSMILSISTETENILGNLSIEFKFFKTMPSFYNVITAHDLYTVATNDLTVTRVQKIRQESSIINSVLFISDMVLFEKFSHLFWDKVDRHGNTILMDFKNASLHVNGNNFAMIYSPY